jgi:hypothetical protein
MTKANRKEKIKKKGKRGSVGLGPTCETIGSVSTRPLATNSSLETTGIFAPKLVCSLLRGGRQQRRMNDSRAAVFPFDSALAFALGNNGFKDMCNYIS